MKTKIEQELLALSKEDLIERSLKTEKELASYHDLLKQTLIENKELKQKLLALEKTVQQQAIKDYDDTLSWVSKIVFTLKKENRPLRSIDLISILKKTEPVLQNHSNKAKVFSAFINSAVKHGRIVRQKVAGVRGYYHLLPSWLNQDGSVTEFYKEIMI